MNEKSRTMIHEDEDIQRMRLLMQYTKFKALAASFQKFSQEVESDKPEAAQKVLVQLVKELLSMELWGQKLQAIKSANRQDQANYERRKVEQQAQIRQAQNDIDAQRELLELAKIERQNNESYEVLRHQVMQYASRSDSLAECQQLESEILALESESIELDLSAERLKKQFATVMHCLEDPKFGAGDGGDGEET